MLFKYSWTTTNFRVFLFYKNQWVVLYAYQWSEGTLLGTFSFSPLHTCADEGWEILVPLHVCHFRQSRSSSTKSVTVLSVLTCCVLFSELAIQWCRTENFACYSLSINSTVLYGNYGKLLAWLMLIINFAVFQQSCQSYSITCIKIVKLPQNKTQLSKFLVSSTTVYKCNKLTGFIRFLIPVRNDAQRCIIGNFTTHKQCCLL